VIRPYYSDELVSLYHGDWRTLLPAGFRADLIVTDPPYGETSLDWDQWPTGWPAIAAKHSDAMWCWGSMRAFVAHSAEFSDWTFSQDLVWQKHNGSGFHRDRFKRIHEHVVLWYRGRWADRWHEVPTTADATRRTVRRKARPPHTGHIGAHAYTSFDGGPRLVRSVIVAPSLHGTAINEAEKPVSINELLISYACPPGGLVADLFAGSCATLVAARLAGRRAIGFERREQQCERAALRLAQLPLDLPIGSIAAPAGIADHLAPGHRVQTGL